MGRVVRKIATDGIDQTTLNDSDVLISYEGCGCAGGLVTTVEGELVPQPGTSNNRRRKQKSYADILGRTFKAETFEWDGTTVYSTAVQSFDGADRVVRARQYAGSTSSTTYQDTTASFDGHGRLYQSHRPEQRDSSNNLKYTTYGYNPDGSILTVTDGRGAVTNFDYNSRGLLTEKNWTVPGGSGITDPTDVTFSYDNLGNRTAMTDGMGAVAYTYDPLSRMTSETRDFTDSLADAPNNGLFTLSYEYTLTGLKSYTDPYGEEIEYAHQKAGRLSAVTGTSFAGVTSYANNPTYRAWGALKHLEFGSGKQMEVSFNSRSQPIANEFNDIANPSAKLLDRDYEYYADGRLKFVNDALGGSSERFDRLFTYDHAGRVKDAKSGIEAQGQTQTNLQLLPYRQSYTFDPFGNITGRTSTMWDYDGDWDFTRTVTNNRSSYSVYDHDGRETHDEEVTSFRYDAAGAMVKTWRLYSTYVEYETLIDRDGDGREAKRSQHIWDPDASEWEPWTVRYLINSAVLGAMVTEAGETGKKLATYVRAGQANVAKQAVDPAGQEAIAWIYRDASGLSSRTSSTGAFVPHHEEEERDALGNNVGLYAVPVPPDRGGNSTSPGGGFTFQSTDWGQCELDGIMTPCSMALRSVEAIEMVVGYRRNARGGTDKITAGFDWGFRWSGYYSVFAPPQVLDIADPTEGPIVINTAETRGIWFTYQFTSLDALNPITLREDEVRDLTHNFLIFINDSECANFIQDVLNAAQRIAEDSGSSARMYSDDIRGMFEAVASQGGFRYGTTILESAYKQDGSTIFGSFSKENAGVEFAMGYTQRVKPGGIISERAANGRNRQQAISMIVTTVHEIAHLAGFSDNQLAHAAAAVLKDPTFRGHPIPLQARSLQDVISASTYFSHRIGEKCGTASSRRDWSGIRVLRQAR